MVLCLAIKVLGCRHVVKATTVPEIIEVFLQLGFQTVQELYMPIICSPQSANEYINKKGCDSIVIQVF